MSSLPQPFLTEEEYLELERKAEFRSEYYRGEMFAMAGGSATHNLLITNLILHLTPAVRQRGCQVYHQDLRVRVADSGLYTYPDVAIVCGKQDFMGNDTLLNPISIIEVLSPSTEAHDRGFKLLHYQKLPSLRDYVLVAQENMSVVHYSLPDGKFRTMSAANDVLTISPGVHICLSDIYAGIQFEHRDRIQRPLP